MPLIVYHIVLVDLYILYYIDVLYSVRGFH